MSREMKDSNISWIGQIPSTWLLTNFRRYTKLKQGLQIAQSERHYICGENRYLYITLKYINTTHDSRIAEYIQEPDEGVMCKKEDILFVRTGSTGMIVTNVEGVFHNNFFKVIYDKDNIIKEYLIYYLKQKNLQEHFKLLAGTTTVSDLNHNNFLSTPLIVPSVKEQVKIVDYLDKELGLIEKNIEKQLYLTEEYKKYKQTLITETVTKGLNSNVQMKDSESEWINDIPIHWNIYKIKHTSWLKGRIGWQGLKSNEYIDEGPFLITGTDFKDGTIDWDSCVHISKERFMEAPDIHIKEEDLLITKDGTIGKVAIAKNCPTETSLNSGVLLIRNTKSIKYDSKLMYYILKSDIFWNWFNMSLTGNSTILHLYQEAFYNFSFPLPPHEEQEEIVTYLDEKCLLVDNIIEQKQRLIEELEAYKKSLIYECVTGKREIPDTYDQLADELVQATLDEVAAIEE